MRTTTNSSRIMDVSVDDLFEKIKQSEQEALGRKAALTELKQSISSVQEKLKINEKECQDLKKELNKKLRELSEHKCLLNVDDIQLNIYRQEKDNLEKELDELNKKQIELKVILDKERSKFGEDLRSFTESYGAGINAGKLSRERSKEELEKLKKEEDLLLRDIQVYEHKKEEVDILIKDKQELQKQLSEAEAEKKRCEQQLSTEQGKTLQMENELCMLKRKLDEKFVSIQEELNRERELEKDLTEKCHSLQKELKSVQHKTWQRKVQKRRNNMQCGSETAQPSGNVQNNDTSVLTRTGETPSESCYLPVEDLELVFSDSEDFDD